MNSDDDEYIDKGNAWDDEDDNDDDEYERAMKRGNSNIKDKSTPIKNNNKRENDEMDEGSASRQSKKRRTPSPKKDDDDVGIYLSFNEEEEQEEEDDKEDDDSDETKVDSDTDGRDEDIDYGSYDDDTDIDGTSDGGITDASNYNCTIQTPRRIAPEIRIKISKKKKKNDGEVDDNDEKQKKQKQKQKQKRKLQQESDKDFLNQLHSKVRRTSKPYIPDVKIQTTKELLKLGPRKREMTPQGYTIFAAQEQAKAIAYLQEEAYTRYMESTSSENDQVKFTPQQIIIPRRVVLTEIGMRWKALTEEQRNDYRDLANFQKELLDAKDILSKEERLERKKLKAMERKRLNYPKRPLGSFMYYKRDYLNSLIEANPDLNYSQVRKLCAEAWKNIDPEEKERYHEIVRLDKERYRREVEEWKEKYYNQLISEQTKKRAELSSKARSILNSM